MVLTDSPYSSGATHKGGKLKSTNKRYGHGEGREYPEFGGDHRDQRSWTMWCSLWMLECERLLRDGGYLLSFCDWRQLPAMTDAMQAAGIVWRGIIPWDKGPSARAPHSGYFRHQAEFIVWGTKGPCEATKHDGPFPGVIRAAVKPTEKYHVAGKPLALCRELLRPMQPGDTVLDLFCGGGSIPVAAREKGLRVIAADKYAHWVDVTRRRALGVK